MIESYGVKGFDCGMNSQVDECKKELERLKRFTRGYIAGMYNRDLPIYRVSIDKRRKIFARIADLEYFIKTAKELKAQQCKDLLKVESEL